MELAIDSPAAPWAPVARAAAAERARRAVLAVARVLAPAGESPSSALEAPSRIRAAELALFFYYLEEFDPGQGHGDAALAWLVEAMSLETGEGSLALHEGLTHVAWVTAHLQDRLFAGGAADPNDEFDEQVVGLLEQAPWTGSFDLMNGLAGLGVYFLERLPRPLAVRALSALVDRLSERAQEVPGGVAWFTPVEKMPDWQREMAPRGYYNLGVAHGLPGVLAVLSGAARAGVNASVASGLVERGVAWLLRQKLPPNERSIFPLWVPEGVEPPAARLGWCYGDAGIAAALLCVAGAMGERRWEYEALDLARNVAAREPDPKIIDEPGVCHGASGLATLFARMYHQSGDPSLAAAAARWTDHALDMRWGDDAGVGGFWSYLGTNSPQADPSFLEGAAGTALALLSVIGDVRPDWHRLLAVSLAPVDS